MRIGNYTLDNSVKLDRAQAKIGPESSEEALLVEYDRLGGLITKGGQKIKTGCFYDSKNKKAFAKPEVIFIYSINGRIVEVPEGTELPGEVRAAKILEESDKKARAKKSTKKEVKAEEVEEEDGE